MKTIYFLVLVIFTGITIFGQPSPFWLYTYDGESHLNDHVYNMRINNNNNLFAMVGYTTLQSNSTDMLTIRFDFTQMTWWIKTFNGSANANDIASDCFIDNNGNTFVTGYTNGINTGEDITTLAYDYNGTKIWQNTWNYNGATTSEIPISITGDPFGNIYVTGFTDPSYSNPGDQAILKSIDIVTIKYNSDGSRAWVQIFNGTGNGTDKPVKIFSDNFGNVYVGGYTYNSISNNDFLLIKYNSSGTIIWTQTFNYGGNTVTGELATSMCTDNSGNMYLTGAESQIGDGNLDFLTLKYDVDGNLIWIALSDISSSDEPSSITTSSDGSVYLTGISYGVSSHSDMTTIKYNSSGVQQWVQTFNGPANMNDYSYSICESDYLNEKKIYVCGTSLNINSNYDYIMIRYNDDGSELWHLLWDGGANGQDGAWVATTNYRGDLIVSGTTMNTSGNYDITAFGISAYVDNKSSISSFKSNNLISETFSLSQNFPNPFNPETNINYSLPSKSEVNITVYDIMGNVVSILVNGKQSEGSHSVKFDGSKFASGIYFYTLTAGEYRETKKMILLK